MYDTIFTSNLQQSNSATFQLFVFSIVGLIINNVVVGVNLLAYEVVEEMSVGTSIGNIAVDANLSVEYSQDILLNLKFKFLTPLPFYFNFDDSSSKLSTAARVDRESICRDDEDDDGGIVGYHGYKMEKPEGILYDSEFCKIERDLAIQAINLPLRFIKIVIEIKDINDNRPVFNPNHLTLTVSEAASVGPTSLVVPSAKDRDTRQFSVVKYHLESEDLKDKRKFQLKTITKADNSTELKLMLMETLDRETRAIHRYRVVAVDGGLPALNGSLHITISVLDSNDNRPIFERSTYNAKIMEDAPRNTAVVVVMAIDADSGDNGRVVYGLSSSTRNNFGKIFEINNITGELVLIGKLDRETKPVYHLSIIASDMGPGSIPSEANVVVNVQDVNDNEPKISINTLHESGANEARVLANSEVDTFVGHVIGNDPDEGRNGQFNCSMENNNFRLKQINRDEYHLVTSSIINNHPTSLPQEHALAIMCQDFGVPPLKSIKRIRIYVIDATDRTPRFTHPTFRGEILEDLKVGESVLQLSVFEAPDFSEEVPKSFSLRGGDSSMFDIDPQNGLIKVSMKLDRETKDELTFDAVVMEMIDSTSSLSQSFGRQESQHSSSSSSSSSLSSSSSSSSTSSSSPVLSSTCQVVIVLQDVNDNAPSFASTSFVFRIVEENNPGSFVGLVAAHDADLFPYNQFQFELLSSPPLHHQGSLSTIKSPLQAFRIDRFSGRISTTRTLDREDVSSYELEVVARDNHNSSLYSMAQVIVELIDLNDNPPIFVFPNSTHQFVTALTPLSEGNLLASLCAVDADAGPNSELRFYITRGDGLRFFHLDPKTGELYLVQSVGYDTTNQSFMLTITVYDGGKPPLWSSNNLQIQFKPAPYLSASSLFFYLFNRNGNSKQMRSDVLPTVVVCLVTLILIVLLLIAIFKVSRQKSRAVGDFFCKESNQEPKQSPEYENSAYNSVAKPHNNATATTATATSTTTSNNAKPNESRNSVVVVRNGKAENKIYSEQSNAT